MRLILTNRFLRRWIAFIYGIFFSYLLIRDFWVYGIKAFVVLEAIFAGTYIFLGIEFAFLMRRTPMSVIAFLTLNVLIWAWLLAGYAVSADISHISLSLVGLLGSVLLLLSSTAGHVLPVPNDSLG